MAGVAAGRGSGAAGVTLVLQPPVEFILRQHGAFRRALEDLTGLWERFVPLVAAMEERWISSRGDGSWPDLAESTLASKQQRGFSLEPLRTDDRPESLYRTLVDPQQAARIGPGSLIWETDVAYAHFHQDGGDVAGRPPQRQVIPDPIPLADRRTFEAATVSWLNEQAALAFGRL